MISVVPTVPDRTLFSITTTSLGCVTAKVGFRRENHAERLQLRRHLDARVLVVHLHLTEVGRATFGVMAQST
jgi:hypothetical protein